MCSIAIDDNRAVHRRHAAVRKRVAVPALPRKSGPAGELRRTAGDDEGGGIRLLHRHPHSPARASATYSACRRSSAHRSSRLVPLARPASSSARLVIDFEPGRDGAAGQRLARREDGELALLVAMSLPSLRGCCDALMSCSSGFCAKANDGFQNLTGGTARSASLAISKYSRFWKAELAGDQVGWEALDFDVQITGRAIVIAAGHRISLSIPSSEV